MTSRKPETAKHSSRNDTTEAVDELMATLMRAVEQIVRQWIKHV